MRRSISLNRWIAVNGYSEENVKHWNNYMEKPWTDLDKRLGRKLLTSLVLGLYADYGTDFQRLFKRGHQSIAVLMMILFCQKHSRTIFQIDRTNRARLECDLSGSISMGLGRCRCRAEEDFIIQQTQRMAHLE